MKHDIFLHVDNLTSSLSYIHDYANSFSIAINSNKTVICITFSVASIYQFLLNNYFCYPHLYPHVRAGPVILGLSVQWLVNNFSGNGFN